MMKKSFADCGYLAQVRRLRKLALAALANYDLKIKKLNFIQHGENCTFQVVAVGNQKYLLRVMRGGYHNETAIVEEMAWLEELAQHNISVPKPVKNINKKWIEKISNGDFPEGRNCGLFKWMDGIFVRQSIDENIMFETGRLLARIQAVQPKQKIKHRVYWNAEGLVGLNPVFGSIQKLEGASLAQQKIINAARLVVFKKLKAFERKFPQRLGMMHADLHFSNLLKMKTGLGAIDFDDSGVGFFAYDLVIPLMSIHHIFKNRKKEIPALRRALIEGYSSVAAWDRHDESILDYLIAARKLTMLGWLQSRSENPRLKKMIKKATRSAVLYIQQQGYA